MFNLIHEAGFAGWFVILFTIAGLAATTTVGRRWGRPGSIAAVWAVVVVAMGIAGFGAGQRMTNSAFRRMNEAAASAGKTITAEDASRRVTLLSRGTAEAAANVILAGHGALLILLVGGVLVLFRKKDAVAPTPAPVAAPALR